MRGEKGSGTRRRGRASTNSWSDIKPVPYRRWDPQSQSPTARSYHVPNPFQSPHVCSWEDRKRNGRGGSSAHFIMSRWEIWAIINITYTIMCIPRVLACFLCASPAWLIPPLYIGTIHYVKSKRQKKRSSRGTFPMLKPQKMKCIVKRVIKQVPLDHVSKRNRGQSLPLPFLFTPPLILLSFIAISRAFGQRILPHHCRLALHLSHQIRNRQLEHRLMYHHLRFQCRWSHRSRCRCRPLVLARHQP